jgi:plastocyanin
MKANFWTMNSLGCAILTAGLVLLQTSQAANTSVEIINFSFQPATATISVGDSVTWTQEDSVTHTSTSDSGVWNSPMLSLNQTFSFTFNTAGNFPYHCSVHPFMTGGVTVQTSQNTRPTLSGPARTPDGKFQFTVNGVSGQTYAVQTSSDLQTWSTIQTITATANAFTVTDTMQGLTAQFYRVQLSQ